MFFSYATNYFFCNSLKTKTCKTTKPQIKQNKDSSKLKLLSPNMFILNELKTANITQTNCKINYYIITVTKIKHVKIIERLI